MQLIKDFSDISKVVGILSSASQEKLLLEINALLLKYINEQNQAPAEFPVPNLSGNNAPGAIPVPGNAGISPELPMSDFQAGAIGRSPPPPQAEKSAGINALKNTFGRSSNLPPPPPSLPLLPPQSMPGVRTIASGALNLKSSFGATKPLVPGGNKKTVLSMLDSLGYIVPLITDVGNDSLKNPGTAGDVYQILKQVDGESSLKQIYMFLFPNMPWGKYIEKIYPLSRERCLNFRKNNSFPADAEILIRLGDLLVAMGLIDEPNLERALQVQREPPPPEPAGNVSVPAWMEKAKSIMQQEPSSGNAKKKLIGDTLVDLGIINKDQLNYVLAIQRWLKNIVEHI